MARSAYMCDVECSLVEEGGQTAIDPMFIKTIAIDYGYQITYMPVIYMIAKFPTNIYDACIKSEKTAKIYLRINRYNAYSKTSLSKKYVEGQFTYVVSDSNPNYAQDLTQDMGADQSYHTIKMALMSMEIMNLSKNSFNGIYGEIDQATLITKGMEGVNGVVKPILYNPEYDTIDIRALNSKMKLFEFLFNKCPFYDTNYMFFIDFEKAYLLDLTGEYCDANDGQLSTVMLDIKQFTVETSYYEGMEIKSGSYYMYINPAEVNITPNKGTDKINNQFVFVNDSGQVDFVDLEVNDNTDSDVKQSFRRGNNPIVYKNMVESNTLVMEIVKENIDSLVITPNKEYILSNSDDYAEYNGKYTLLSKQEYFVNNSGSFGMSTTIKLRKVGKITKVGANVVTEASNRSKSASRRYSSSSSKSGSTRGRGKGSSGGGKSNNGGGGKSNGQSTMELEDTPLYKLPEVRRVRASSDFSLKRQPRKISGEG